MAGRPLALAFLGYGKPHSGGLWLPYVFVHSITKSANVFLFLLLSGPGQLTVTGQAFLGWKTQGRLDLKMKICYKEVANRYETDTNSAI